MTYIETTIEHVKSWSKACGPYVIWKSYYLFEDGSRLGLHSPLGQRSDEVHAPEETYMWRRRYYETRLENARKEYEETKAKLIEDAEAAARRKETPPYNVEYQKANLRRLKNHLATIQFQFDKFTERERVSENGTENGYDYELAAAQQAEVKLSEDTARELREL